MVTHALALLVVLLALNPAAVFADDFGSQVSGQHVYDRASVLSAADVQAIEAKASSLENLGAPAVVFIQVKQATQQQAQQDARDLMDAWNVRSSASTHDGFVMLFDLNPDDVHHGQVGLFAGADYTSQLSTPELNRIATQVMRPSLSSGDLAGGIRQGLDATASDIQQAPASADDTPPQSHTGWPGVINWVLSHNPFFLVIVGFILLTGVRRAFFPGTYRRGGF